MQHSSQTTQAPSSQHLVEAARYALLRRLAFAMRHQMVVHLQPIGMITEVMERRRKAAAPDLAQVHESMAKINGFSRAAVQACLDVITWLAPEPGSASALDTGVAECLAQLRSNFSFRGFTLQSDVAVPLAVSRAGLRSVLPACLLALTDQAGAPAEVIVAAQAGTGQATLTVTVRPTQGPAGFQGDAPYRLLRWHEVQALAADEGIALTRQDNMAQMVLHEVSGTA
jgi:hypothetical protein